MTRVLHTARIDSVMFVNRIRKIVRFELSKKMEKDFFFATHARDDTKNIFNMFPPIEAL